MKKLVISLFCIMLAIAVHAEEHMEFMGISFNMSIDDFATQLESNGFQLAPESKKAPKGERLFKGKFSGNEVKLTVSYGVHTMEVTNVKVHFPVEKDFQQFYMFYEAMKRIITEKYCSEGEVINEQGSMDTLPTYGMKMDYGKVIVAIDPALSFGLYLLYTDDANTLEERKLRYD